MVAAQQFDAAELAQELTIKQAAEALGVHPLTIHRYIRAGRLPARNAALLSRQRARWRIALTDILAIRGGYQTSAVKCTHSKRREPKREPTDFNWRD